MRIKHDPFLSQTLKLNCGSVTQWSTPWKFGVYDFVTFKTDNLKYLQQALKRGFRYITTNVFLQRVLQSPPPAQTRQAAVRSLQKADIPQVVDLARECFTLDRFHSDAQLGKARADAIYERWAENDCNGRASEVLVAPENGTILGFLTVHQTSIDLMAVHPRFANRGVGSALLQAALTRHPITETVTQINNPVISFYEKRGGFIPSGIIHVLHGWRSDS